MRAQFQQTMIRVKNLDENLAFFTKHFGMTHITTLKFPEWKFDVAFLATLLPEQVEALKQAESPDKYLWSANIVTLELTYNYEEDPDVQMNNGNEEPHRGFGHIAFNLPNGSLEAVCDKLVADGVKFKKLPSEGRMKTMAFCYSPDRYWIELVQRHPDYKPPMQFNLSQTMLRVKDPKASLDFYTKVMGMKLLETRDFSDFSLFFLADPSQCGEETDFKKLWHPVLELTHNHGTEKDEAFHYHNGNDDPRGFGHIGFLVDDLEGFCAQPGLKFRKRPEEGNMRQIAFLLDPDGYSVELIQRGFNKN